MRSPTRAVSKDGALFVWRFYPNEAPAAVVAVKEEKSGDEGSDKPDSSEEARVRPLHPRVRCCGLAQRRRRAQEDAEEAAALPLSMHKRTLRPHKRRVLAAAKRRQVHTAICMRGSLTHCLRCGAQGEPLPVLARGRFKIFTKHFFKQDNAKVRRGPARERRSSDVLPVLRVLRSSAVLSTLHPRLRARCLPWPAARAAWPSRPARTRR
jgi:hypothetical protein